jgi:hypothetical protein
LGVSFSGARAAAASIASPAVPLRRSDAGRSAAAAVSRSGSKAFSRCHAFDRACSMRSVNSLAASRSRISRVSTMACFTSRRQRATSSGYVGVSLWPPRASGACAPLAGADIRSGPRRDPWQVSERPSWDQLLDRWSPRPGPGPGARGGAWSRRRSKGPRSQKSLCVRHWVSYPPGRWVPISRGGPRRLCATGGPRRPEQGVSHAERTGCSIRGPRNRFGRRRLVISMLQVTTQATTRTGPRARDPGTRARPNRRRAPLAGEIPPASVRSSAARSLRRKTRPLLAHS